VVVPDGPQAGAGEFGDFTGTPGHLSILAQART
jgi:hypothetical protein